MQQPIVISKANARVQLRIYKRKFKGISYSYKFSSLRDLSSLKY